MTAKDIITCLNDMRWVECLSKEQYPFITKMKTKPIAYLQKEVTIRVPNLEKTRFGKPKPQRRRFDLIAVVKPFYSAYGNDIFTVGIEIKVSKNDLDNDNKYLDYLGYTNYFFFAVPTELVPNALEKTQSNPLIGVVDATGNKIIKLPEIQKVCAQNSMELFRQLVCNFSFSQTI